MPSPARSSGSIASPLSVVNRPLGRTATSSPLALRNSHALFGTLA